MKLDADVLIEIVGIVQEGLLLQEDISQKLRDLDLVDDGNLLCLSDEYLDSKGRN